MIFKIPEIIDGKTYIRDVEVGVFQSDGGLYVFQSGYNAQLISELKMFYKARWNPDDKVWTAPICERNTYTLNYLIGNKVDRLTCKIIDETVFDRALAKHQIEGIHFALTRKTCMLNHDPGLGKTLIGIEIIERSGIPYNWLLVAPYGAQKTWERELIKWEAKFKFIHVTTYESAHKYLSIIEEDNGCIPHGIIIDESIKICNVNAARSKAVAGICILIRQANGYIIELSGAPAPREPIQWHHQIECLQPGFIREPTHFKLMETLAEMEWVDEGYGKFPKVYSWKDDEVKRLGRRLAPIVHRRNKDSCLDLPEKIFEIITCRTKDETLKISKLIIETSEGGADARRKLRQVSDGFVYVHDEDQEFCVECNGTGHHKEGNSLVQCEYCEGVGKIFSKTRRVELDKTCPKLEILKGLLDFHHRDNGGCGRILVFAVFHASVDLLIAFIKEGGWDVDKIDGRGWSSSTILERFEGVLCENYCVVAHPGSVHGTNFQRAGSLIYYSNDDMADNRVQSLERADRLSGRTVGTKIVDIINLPIDRLILNKLNKGLDGQSITMEEIEAAYGIN